MHAISAPARGALLASLVCWAVTLLPAPAMANGACPDGSKPLVESPKPGPAEFRIDRHGSVERRRVNNKGTLEVADKEKHQYRIEIQVISHRTMEPLDGTVWCLDGVEANTAITLPEVTAPDFLNVSVLGRYDEDADKDAHAALLKRELSSERRTKMASDWRRHTLLQLESSPSYAPLLGAALVLPPELEKNIASVLKPGAACSKAGTAEFQGFCAALRNIQKAKDLEKSIASVLKPGATCSDPGIAELEGICAALRDVQEVEELKKKIASVLKPGAACSDPGTAELEGICAALRDVHKELLVEGRSAQEQSAAYTRVFANLPLPSEQEGFCRKAHQVNALEVPDELEQILLSQNQLPAPAQEEIYELVLGEKGPTRNGASVGAQVVTWIHKVPSGTTPKVTWTVDDSSKPDVLKPLADFLTVLAKFARSDAAAHSLRDSSSKIIEPDEERSQAAFLEQFGLDTSCPSESISPPVLASEGSMVHVDAPLKGYETYRVSACVGENCEKDPKASPRAEATVHTQVEGWRMTLSLGFNGHARLSRRQFGAWRWRPVGSATGPEQLYEYSRASDPLSHTSASLMLTFLSPYHPSDSTQLGLALGPSLLVGKDPQPLRQWSLNGVLAFRQGFHLTAGVGVRFEDVPMDMTRAGELQFVPRSADAHPPDIDQRRTPALMANVGFALDLSFIADGGSALLKAVGVSL